MRPIYECLSCLFTESDYSGLDSSSTNLCKIFSLLQISPCFPGSRWMAFGLRKATLIIRAIGFQDFQPM